MSFAYMADLDFDQVTETGLLRTWTKRIMGVVFFETKNLIFMFRY